MVKYKFKFSLNAFTEVGLEYNWIWWQKITIKQISWTQNNPFPGFYG